jgi:hypothetical protein
MLFQLTDSFMVLQRVSHVDRGLQMHVAWALKHVDTKILYYVYFSAADGRRIYINEREESGLII